MVYDASVPSQPLSDDLQGPFDVEPKGTYPRRDGVLGLPISANAQSSASLDKFDTLWIRYVGLKYDVGHFDVVQGDGVERIARDARGPAANLQHLPDNVKGEGRAASVHPCNDDYHFDDFVPLYFCEGTASSGIAAAAGHSLKRDSATVRQSIL